MVLLITVCVLLCLCLVWSQKTKTTVQEDYTDEKSAKFFEKWLELTQKNGHLPKTVNNEKQRVLFIAGLEGTGHHALKEMLLVCKKKSQCRPASNLTKSFMEYNNGRVHGLFSVSGVTKSTTLAKKSFSLFSEIFSSADVINKDGELVIIAGGMTKYSGMFSYPNYDGNEKFMNHPDIYTLATMAELSNIDLRILILQRSAKEIIASTHRRKFGGGIEDKILVESASALYTEASMIDPKFFYCLEYRELGNLSSIQKQNLGEFLHPTVIPPLMEEMLGKIKYSPKSESSNSTVKKEDYKPTSYYQVLLESRVRLMEKLCHDTKRRL